MSSCEYILREERARGARVWDSKPD